MEEGGATAASEAPRRDAAGPDDRKRATRVDVAREREVLELRRKGRYDDAVRVLMTIYGGPVLGYARRVLRDEQVAQDIRQQVFVEAWRGLAKFEARASLWTWLCAITYNRCIDAARRRGRIDAGEVAVDIDVLDAVRDPSEESMSPERIAQRRALEKCLRKLPIAIRVQVLMRTYQGLSYDEIAEITGDAAGTVQVRIARVLPKLQRCLRAEGVR